MRDIKFRVWNKDLKKMLNTYNSFIFKELEDGRNIEVMQYTGLTDKNGTEIYEGDIIEGEWCDMDETKQEVFEVECHGSYIYPFSEPTGASSGWLYHTSLNPSDFEIIGNIYENPELIGATA